MRNGLNKGFVGFKDSFFRLRLLNVSNNIGRESISAFSQNIIQD